MVSLGTGKHWDFFGLWNTDFKSKFVYFIFLSASCQRVARCLHPLILEPSGQPASRQHKLKPQCVPYASCSCINSERETKDPWKKEQKSATGVFLKEMLWFATNSSQARRLFGKRTFRSWSEGRSFRSKRGLNEVISTATNYFVDLQSLWFPGNISMRTMEEALCQLLQCRTPMKASYF